MRFKVIALFTILFCVFIHSKAQEKNSGPKKVSLKSERKIRKELRLAAREKRRKERAERKAIKKYHKRLQTKAVQKRMRASRKSAIRYNEHKREPFIVRWFKKKKRL
jgi:hypothetical protein